MENKLDWRFWVLEKTGAHTVERSSLVQELWGGYGQLLRVRVGGSSTSSVVLKWIQLPPGLRSFSHFRKRRSYQVETFWYKNLSSRCDENCRVPRCLGAEDLGDGFLLLLEDLGESGYGPVSQPSLAQTKQGLRWLANFHALFLNFETEHLWSQGCYWHLETRPDEWEVMAPGPLKDSAHQLDALLRKARFQTLVHGDAKSSNFCWNSENEVAAVDFQYLGGGCGIRDVALLLDRCLGKSGCAQFDQDYLDIYFDYLFRALEKHGRGDCRDELEAEWRGLYPVAWADYCRFRQGWTQNDKLDSYSLQQIEKALKVL